MQSDSNKAKISSIKTYVLVAWIFAILVNVGVLLLLIFIVIMPLILGLSIGFSYILSTFAVSLLIPLIIILIFNIPSYLVMRRAGRLYSAAKRGDVQALKANNSLGWGIVALIFTGVVPGIMLLLANGPIDELKETPIKSQAIESSTIGTASIDKLERLKDLLDKGVITQEEFDSQKAKILKDL